MTANLADRFEATVDRHADRPALITETTTTTYAELDRSANRFANSLRGNGLGDGARIGLALWNRPEHIAALLGTFKAGAIPINVNTRYTASELGSLLCDAEVRLVVHEPSLTLTLDDITGHRTWQRVALDESFTATLASMSADRPQVSRSGDDHYILFTGGTTGHPKGVVWRHEDLGASALAGAELRRPGTRVLPASPLIHGTAQWSTLSTLFGGGAVVLGDPFGLDPERLWDLVETCRVTRLVIVGDAFARPLLDALDTSPDRWDLSSLVVIASGGARWSHATQDGLLDHLPHVAMTNSFGASETGGQGSEVTFAGQSRTSEVGLLRFPADDTTSVLDATGRPLPPGSDEVGVLARRGPVPIGYLNDPERSARTFPVVDGVRHAVPGDLAMLEADGTVVVLGRDRNVINTGGEKVYAENVEAVLVSHPEVADAVVGSVPDERWGERVTAIVSLRRPDSTTVDELTAHCRANLAGFKVPRRILIAPEIRRRHTGKLDRSWAADTMARSE